MKRVFNLCVLALSLFVAAMFAFKGQYLAAYIIASVAPAVTVPWSHHVAGVFHNLSIPEHYMRAFQANWGHTVQQETADLARIVTIDNIEGKEKVYTDLNQVTFNEKRGRLGNTNLQEVTGNKRKMFRRYFSCHIIFDKDDNELLGMLGEPTSELQVEMRYAFNRSLDDGLIEAASGTVYGGAEPYVTPITLPDTQKVAVDFVYSGAAANSGLTPDKLQRAIKLFEDNSLSITKEEFVLAISPRQREDLFQYVKSAPNDGYSAMIGEWFRDPSKKLFGFTVIVSTRLAVASDIRTCLAWSRRGIYAAPDKMEVKIGERADKEHARQVSSYGQWGFMRRYEERVVEIKCDESP